MSKKLKLEDMTNNNDDQKYQNLIQNNNETNDEIALLAISELLNPKKLKSISRIKFEQVQVISKLYLFHKVFGVPFTKNLADLMLKLQISVNGLGRKEFVQMVQQRNDMFDMLQKPKRSKEIFK